MATFTNFCLMVTFMASATLLVKRGLSYEDYDPSEGPLPPLTNLEKQMLDCIMKLHTPCDELYMYGTIFTSNEKVSKDCCTHIVHDFGKQCHDIMTNYIINLPKYKANRTLFSQRSKQVWNECSHPSFQLDEGLGQSFASDPSSVSNSSSPSPSPENYLKDCAAKLYPDCGNELYSAIFFDNDTVSKECCQNLVVDLGKTCNDKMTMYILELPQFKPNKTQILQRSDEIWRGCKD